MTGLSRVTTFTVPRRLVDEVMDYLRQVGHAGSEGLALWAGRHAGEAFDVTHMLIPRQEAIRTPTGVGYVVGAEELYRLNVWLFENGLRLAAQIHSHPADAYHSGTDDEFPIATAVGSLSLVIPDFASAAFSLRTAAVYRLSQAALWEELTIAQAEDLIRITD